MNYFLPIGTIMLLSVDCSPCSSLQGNDVAATSAGT